MGGSFKTARAILKAEEIAYIEDIRGEVKALEKIRILLYPETSEVDFAINLFDIPVNQHYGVIKRMTSSANLGEEEKEILLEQLVIISVG